MSKNTELIGLLRAGADGEKDAYDESGMIFGMSFTMETAADAIEALERENEALRKDAARYQWLRDAGAWESEVVLDSLTPEEFDTRVDEAIAERAQEARP